MMKWNIKFKEELHTELTETLFSNSPKENGCFLLANIKGNVLFISEIYYPENTDWIILDKDVCIPSPQYISKACIHANIKNKTLVFVHTHPEEFHTSLFSPIDDISNTKLFKNLEGIINKPLGSFVLSRKGIHGVIYNNGKQFQIEKYSVYGDKVKILKDVSSVQDVFDNKEFDRQIRFLKERGQNTISNLNIAVIGLGGTGSPLAVMLAKMGVKNISLFDFDILEKHNLPRIYGASKSDIGKYKVDIVKKHINSFSDSTVKVYTNDIQRDSDLTSFDFIFGCIDNHTARDILNTIAFKNAIPYIDTGTSIPLGNNGEVSQSVIAVNTVIPNRPCLWCSNTLNAMNIMEENMSDNELVERKNDGYLQGVEKTPSIITLTTAVSTFAINRMLNLLNILPGKYPLKMMFEFNNSMYISPKVELNKSCICQKLNPFN